MLGILANLAEQTGSHPYLGDDAVRRARSQAELLRPEDRRVDRWTVYYELGVGELRLGNEDAAIEALTSAYELLPRVAGRIGADATANTVLRLGVAWLRLGEVRNCCARNAEGSCILPIRGDAVHTDAEGSENAMRYFTELLTFAEATSVHAHAARWLLNVAAMTLGRWPEAVPPEHRVAPDLFETGADFPHFRNVASGLGLDTVSLAGGVVVDDLDGDDDLDVMTSSWAVDGPMHVFRNDGNGTFSDVTEAAGLTGFFSGLNLVPADYDNDGDLDVLVLRGAWAAREGRVPNSLLTNDGTGRFTDRAFEAGFGESFWPTQAGGWADYDLDGDLDLYVGNESGRGLTAPSHLFRNEGDGTFAEVGEEAGVRNYQYAKGVAWGDYDNDRDPDLYVSNRYGPNRLYRNEGDGTFTDVAPATGTTSPTNSFPTWFWDFDNDGNLDIAAFSYTGTAVNLSAFLFGYPLDLEPDRIYRGDGNGGFTDVGSREGRRFPTLAMGANFGDLDNDGWLDFYLGTGDPDYVNIVPNVMMRNRRGQGFEDVTMAGGFGHLQKGHGVAFADLDSDGDLDVFEQMGGAYLGDDFRDALYENPGAGNGWLCVQVVGTRSNRSGLGVRLRAVFREEEAERSVYRDVTSGGSFGAAPLRQTLGLGRASVVDRLEIFWPVTGETQILEDVPGGQVIRVTEGRDGWDRVSVPVAHWDD
ncbi:MAG TPA: CRTAC1 family protein [bacterium]|nr:CRTAC1 family protein [bacterium]